MTSIKQGYKQTKVGIIPADWEVVKLESISDFITKGATPTTHGFNWQDDGITFLRSECVSENGLNLKAAMFICQDAHNIMKRSAICSGDILMTITGNVGRVILLKNFQEGNINQHIARIRVIKNLANKNFIFSFLSQNIYQINYSKITTGQAYPQLSLVQVRNSLVPLPPLKEQEKIAEILTTWNEAISLHVKLIEEKEHLKIGLMQKFLSGEVRFEGFCDKWKEVRLGEIGNPFNGLSGKTAEDFGTGKAQYITYKNIFDYSKIKLDIFENVKISDDEKQNLVQFGDIFFTVSSETPEEVGMSSVLLDNISNTYLNSFCFGYRLNNFDILDPYFARFYFRNFYMRDKISRLAQGSTRFNLSKNEIMKLKVKLPPLLEQQKIAEVLSLADDELSLLKKELEELKQQKKGLMQKLLTGEVRVKV